VLRLCYCVVRACEERNKTIQISCSANYAICRAPCVTTVLLCGACVCGTEKKKFKSLAQQTTRFSAPRSMLGCSLPEHVFVVRTQKSFAKVLVVRFVRCPNCSLTGHPLYFFISEWSTRQTNCYRKHTKQNSCNSNAYQSE